MDLSQDQQNQLRDQVNRGQAFEILIRQDGWKLIKAWYQAKIQQFASAILLQNKPIAEFEAERRELMGIRTLLGMIENDLEVARKENEKTRSATKKQ